jgi:hypothetical protein
MEGYALLIGINTVDYTKYQDSKELCSAYKNVSCINELLEKTTLFDTKNVLIRHNELTKWEAICADIDSLVSKTDQDPNESYIFLYFFGHGTPRREVGSSTDTQFLCFYDQIVHERLIQEQLERFNERCKVFVVLDACYGHGIILDLSLSMKSFNKSISISSMFANHYINELEKYETVVEKYKEVNFEPKASFFFFFACGPDEITEHSPNCSSLSNFSTFFHSDWSFVRDSTISPKNYDSLFKVLKTSHPKAQKSPEKVTDPFFINTYPLIFKS